MGLTVKLLQNDSSLNVTRGEIIVYRKDISINNSEHWSPAMHSIHSNRPTMALKSSRDPVDLAIANRNAHDTTKFAKLEYASTLTSKTVRDDKVTRTHIC